LRRVQGGPWRRDVLGPLVGTLVLLLGR
jgi:hypothetical protein